MDAMHSPDGDDLFSRIWEAYDAGEIVHVCAWCSRVRVDETWQLPPRGVLVAIDSRFTLSHSICETCLDMLGQPTLAGAPGGDGEPRHAKE
jgi:hypothetical protein